ncbi:MAG TPA: DMT family transporter [Thermoanaerobaculia bacterium]|jgi:drug/metabolite transporter (DMT)-like permease|nr:DMT family transporter [Thermoanaerobaculia bacterium]
MTEPVSRTAAAATPKPAPASRVHLTLLLVQLSFGGFHVVAKALLSHLSPLAMAAIRVGFATPILLALAWHRDRVLPGRRDLPVLALLGGLGVFANQVLFITGLKHTTATNAAILMLSVPVFATAAAAALGIERVSAGRLLGIALSIAGALVLVNPLHFSTDPQAAQGNLLILGNGLCYALFLVLQRPVLTRLPWRTVIAWSFLFGSLGVLAVAAPALAALEPSQISAATWLGLLYILAFPTVFAYAASTWAIRRSSPALVAAYTTLQPLVAAALAVAFLGERFGWAEGLGFALILGGLWLVTVAAPAPARAIPLR